MSEPRDEAVRLEIERRAYERFCDRGCAPGADVEDWLAAEGEVLESRKSETAPDNPPGAKPRPNGRKVNR